MMAKIPFTLLLVIFIGSGFISEAQKMVFTRYDSLRGSLTKYRSCYNVKYYDLQLQVKIEEKQITGFNKITLEALDKIDTIQLDLFKNLKIDSIIFRSKSLTYSRDSNSVFIFFPVSITKKTLFDIIFYYHGSPVIASLPPWDGGFIWSTDSLKRPWIAVACEGLGASSWWPVKDHLYDEPDSVSFSMDVPNGLYCVSNGRLANISPLKNGLTRFSWKIGYPINTYNVTFYIGHYSHFADQFLDSLKTELALDYYVLDTHVAIAKKHFKQVQKIMRCFNERFGPYPFPKDGYSLVEAPYWGMEHQGAIAYGNHFKTDLYDFDFIIVHETAHEWWGNSLSVSDHADMWIHEAFATYAESILLEDTYGPQIAIDYLNMQKTKIKNKQAMLGPGEVNYNKWEDTDIYYKGAWMLHTLRHTLSNDSLWFALLKHLTQKFKISIVNTEIIVNEINRFTKRDLSGFFAAYLSCPDIPQIDYYFEKIKKHSTMKYRLKSCGDSLQMPAIVYIGDRELQLNITKKWQSLPLNKEDTPVLSISEDRFYLKLNKVKETSTH